MNAWSKYERRKAEWLRQHPDSTEKEYEKAIKQIAKELKI